MAGHRYWRLLFTACPYNTNVSCATVTLAESAGGANLATDPNSALASGTDTRGPFTAAAAIVGQPSFWSAPDQSGLPQWWGYDFGAASPPDIREFSLTARSDAYPSQFTATAMDAQWSDDAAAWTQAWHVDTPSWSSGETRVFTHPAATAPGLGQASQSGFDVIGANPLVAGQASQSGFDVIGRAAYPLPPPGLQGGPLMSIIA